MGKSVPELLRSAAQTYEERHKLYGDNYKHFGKCMKGIFPEPLTIETEEEWVRVGLILNIVTKVTRYGQNLKKGGHQDSIHDASVYCSMLEEMTDGN